MSECTKILEDRIRTFGPGAEDTDTDAATPPKSTAGRPNGNVEAWFQSHTGKNGYPLKTENKDAADQRKYVALSREEKEMLVDVASGAAISLRDAHGDILQAIRNSLTNRSVDITVE